MTTKTIIFTVYGGEERGDLDRRLAEGSRAKRTTVDLTSSRREVRDEPANPEARSVAFISSHKHTHMRFIHFVLGSLCLERLGQVASLIGK